MLYVCKLLLRGSVRLLEYAAVVAVAVQPRRRNVSMSGCSTQDDAVGRVGKRLLEHKNRQKTGRGATKKLGAPKGPVSYKAPGTRRVKPWVSRGFKNRLSLTEGCDDQEVGEQQRRQHPYSKSLVGVSPSPQFSRHLVAQKHTTGLRKATDLRALKLVGGYVNVFTLAVGACRFAGPIRLRRTFPH